MTPDPSEPPNRRPAMRRLLPLLALLAVPLARPGAARSQAAVPGVDPQVRQAIVKVYTVHRSPDYHNPWNMHGAVSSTGSGCIIDGNRILTNAHVVRDQAFVQVRRNGDFRRIPARVVAVNHSADLAILTVDAEGFFDGIPTPEFGELPETLDEVLVYGFPLGGDTLSITKGVLSRIEHQTYAHSGLRLLAGQIDAAINPGNSGGPVLVNNRIVGIAMQGIASADNIGYMVPVPVIRHFLADLEDGTLNGFPSLGVLAQNMENPDLKAKYRLREDDTGVLVVNVLPASSAHGILESGDVLLSVEGQEIGDDGTVEFRSGERTHYAHFIQQKQIGESVRLEILRDGEMREVDIRLNRALHDEFLVPRDRYDILPTYYLFGGLVFTPLTKNLLNAWGRNWATSAPRELVELFVRGLPEKDGDQVVLMLKVMAADVNVGYHSVSNWIVSTVNGIPIRNLRELAGQIERIRQEAEEPFLVLADERGQQIVLGLERAEAAHAGILARYRIPADRSDDLADLEPAPAPEPEAEAKEADAGPDAGEA